MTKTYALYIILFLFTIQAHANIIVLNGLTHKYKTSKGEVYRGSIEIQNIGNTKQQVKVYIQDMIIISEGSTDYTDPGSHPLSNASWITLNNNLVEINPNEKVEVFYDIAMPENINQEGSYWSICMVEPIDEITPNSQNKGFQIKSILRYAVQIITDYNVANLTPKIKFKSINLEQGDTKKILKIELSNEGTLLCEPSIYLEIYDTTLNKKVDEIFESANKGILPNTSKSFSIDLTKLPRGSYKTIAFAKDKDDNVFALEFDLNNHE